MSASAAATSSKSAVCHDCASCCQVFFGSTMACITDTLPSNPDNTPLMQTTFDLICQPVRSWKVQGSVCMALDAEWL
jgi:hypothetical protein